MSLLTRIFPTPDFLTLPTVGIDFSGRVMRFVELQKTAEGVIPVRFGEVEIPTGCMQAGRVSDEKLFTTFLQQAKKQHNLNYVRVAIPESQVYLFTLAIDSVVANDIRSAIELSLEDNIPLKAIETVFDFSVLKVVGNTIIVQVVAVAEATTTMLFSCFTNAGITPVSFELDAQAIARAVLPKNNTGSQMIVDIGAHRTSITVTAESKVVYTATIEFGGNMLTEILSTKLAITTIEAEELKRSIGLSHTPQHADFFEVLSVSIAPLTEEINRRFIYWQERKDQMGNFSSIKTVYLCGGHSNLHGLTDYLSATLHLPVVQVNPWVKCFTFEKYIPAMSFDMSMSYVAAIGLSITDFHND